MMNFERLESSVIVITNIIKGNHTTQTFMCSLLNYTVSKLNPSSWYSCGSLFLAYQSQENISIILQPYPGQKTEKIFNSLFHIFLYTFYIFCPSAIYSLSIQKKTEKPYQFQNCTLFLLKYANVTKKKNSDEY